MYHEQPIKPKSIHGFGYNGHLHQFYNLNPSLLMPIYASVSFIQSSTSRAISSKGIVSLEILILRLRTSVSSHSILPRNWR
jgi:hypothetical protein